MWTASERDVTEFVESKGATAVYKQFVAAIKRRGRALLPNCLTGYFSSSNIMRLLDDRPGRPGFATLFAQKGIRVVVCKKITGLEPGEPQPSAEPDVRTFLWVELVDEAVMAEPGQSTTPRRPLSVPDRRRTRGFWPCGPLAQPQPPK